MCVFEPCEFFGNFFASFLAELLIAVGIGIAFTIWWDRKQKQQEQAEHSKVEKRAAAEKAILYLGMFRDEFEHWLDALPHYTDAIKNDRGFLSRGTYWDVLLPGGELPKLLSPFLLRMLTQFYSVAASVDQWGAIALTTKVQMTLEMKEALLRTLEDVPSIFSNLPKHIASEIYRLEQMIETA